MLWGEADTAAARFESLIPDLLANNEAPLVLQCHRLLSDIYQRSGQAEAALELM